MCYNGKTLYEGGGIDAHLVSLAQMTNRCTNAHFSSTPLLLYSVCYRAFILIEMQKTFKVAQVRDLLNQVHNEKITFSRFVEILNEHAEGKRKFDIKQLDDSLSWVKWLEESKSNGLNEASQSDAIRDIYTKINEVVRSLNAL